MRAKRILRLAALCGALSLVTQAASADHGTCTVTVDPPHADSYSDVTITLDFDDLEASTMELRWPDGWSIAQQTGTSPISPIPNDEDTVGAGSWTAKWVPLLCAEATRNFTITWEATIDAGAPANTVAQLVLTAGAMFEVDVYVVRNGANDYDMEFPDMPDELICASTEDQRLTAEFYGTVPDLLGTTRRFTRTPATTGTHTWTWIYTDTAATTHTTTCGATLSSGGSS